MKMTTKVTNPNKVRAALHASAIHSLKARDRRFSVVLAEIRAAGFDVSVRDADGEVSFDGHTES